MGQVLLWQVTRPLDLGAVLQPVLLTDPKRVMETRTTPGWSGLAAGIFVATRRIDPPHPVEGQKLGTIGTTATPGG